MPPRFREFAAFSVRVPCGSFDDRRNMVDMGALGAALILCSGQSSFDPVFESQPFDLYKRIDLFIPEPDAVGGQVGCRARYCIPLLGSGE